MKLLEFFNIPTDKVNKVDSQGRSKIDQDDLEDRVYYFILDNDELHKRYVLPFAKSIRQKLEDPNFQKNKYKKYWIPMIDKGCDIFYKDNKLKDNPVKMFNKELRDALCVRFNDEIIDHIQNKMYKIGDHKL